MVVSVCIEQHDSSFFEGKLLEPVITARCLRTVSDLVGTRFYIPPSMLARIIREADPVVTVSSDALRFEGFSSCCSAYVRHDLTADCYAAENIRVGTTNVDFGADMRAALAKVNCRAEGASADSLDQRLCRSAISSDRDGKEDQFLACSNTAVSSIYSSLQS